MIPPVTRSDESDETRFNRVLQLFKRQEKLDANKTSTYTAVIQVPTDGGYGWVIVVIAFFGLMIVDGITYTFYLVRPGLIKDGFNERDCALSISTVNSLSMLVAPISSAFCNVLGFRIVMLIGSVIASLGLALAYLGATYGFIAFYFTYGITAGFGIGFMYIPLMIPTGMWFDKTRPLAIGIATCGTGVGMIALPCLLDYLLTIVNYKYLFFVLSGLMLINAFMSLLVRPVPVVEVDIQKRRIVSDILLTRRDITAREFIGTSKYQVREKTPFSVAQSSHRLLIGDEKMRLAKARRSTTARLSQILSRKKLEGPSYLAVIRENCCDRCLNFITCRDRHWIPQTGQRPMYKNDIFYQGSVLRFNKQLETDQLDTALKYSMHVSRLPTKNDIKHQVECKMCCPESLVRGFKDMADVRLFKKLSFITYCISTFFYYIVVTVPMLYLNSYIKQEQKSENPPYIEWLIPCMGLGIFTGRLTGGILLQLVPTLSPMSMCLGLGFFISTATAVQPFTFYYFLYFIYAFGFGISFGLYATLRNFILLDYVGLEKLTSATGIVFGVAGVSNLIGPPTAVALTKNGENMEMAFFFSGILFLVSTLALIPLLFMKKAGETGTAQEKT